MVAFAAFGAALEGASAASGAVLEVAFVAFEVVLEGAFVAQGVGLAEAFAAFEAVLVAAFAAFGAALVAFDSFEAVPVGVPVDPVVAFVLLEVVGLQGVALDLVVAGLHLDLER